MKAENIIVQRFSEQMLIELEHNRHKGSILKLDNLDKLVMELEYHKAKMFLAIRTKNRTALKEYIADQANILLAIGNRSGVYDNDTVDDGICHELNVGDAIHIIPALQSNKSVHSID